MKYQVSGSLSFLGFTINDVLEEIEAESTDAAIMSYKMMYKRKKVKDIADLGKTWDWLKERPQNATVMSIINVSAHIPGKEPILKSPEKEFTEDSKNEDKEKVWNPDDVDFEQIKKVMEEPSKIIVDNPKDFQASFNIPPVMEEKRPLRKRDILPLDIKLEEDEDPTHMTTDSLLDVVFNSVTEKEDEEYNRALRKQAFFTRKIPIKRKPDRDTLKKLFDNEDEPRYDWQTLLDL